MQPLIVVIDCAVAGVIAGGLVRLGRRPVRSSAPAVDWERFQAELQEFLDARQ